MYKTLNGADMMVPEAEPSKIVKFYANSTIFLTGATGYLGKMCLEKLLRDCNDLKKIYVMVRPKKGKDVQTRFKEIFDGPNMEPLKRSQPNFQTKVTLINGDCSLTNLGLSVEDRERLINETNCVFHYAATVRFDEKIRTATYINVRAVMDVLKMVKQMKNLKAVVYVSTAFSNCVRKEINEIFYPPPINGNQLLSLIEALDDSKLDLATPIILGDFPNTYAFTKAVAEDVIRSEGKNLPIVVFRPSIVIASAREPVAGWIDNLYGPTGVVVGGITGVLRCLHGRREHIAEMVPADYVVNCVLALGWDIASMKSMNENKKRRENDTGDLKFVQDVGVYNFVSSPESPISWDIFTKLTVKHSEQIPPSTAVWRIIFSMRSSRFHHLLAVFLFHTIPAYIIDFIAICLGMEPRMVKGYQKINKLTDGLTYFACREWIYSNNNVQTLWQKLNKRDQKMFEFTMTNFDWNWYCYTYVKGARMYLLKDPMSTVKEGIRKKYKLMVLHYVLLTVLALVFYKVLTWLYFCVFFIIPTDLVKTM